MSSKKEIDENIKISQEVIPNELWEELREKDFI